MSESRSGCEAVVAVGKDRHVTLAVAYERCRQLHREHGRSYYLATRLLPAWKRRHVHALYGFARHTDEIVDSFDEVDITHRELALDDWAGRFMAGLDGAAVDDPVLPAVLHTIEVFQLDTKDFIAFLHSMRMDLTVTSYATYPELLDYMEGSAAAIGAMMLPVLGTRRPDDVPAALEPARELGRAFQLTNFIRDVGEDLRRGRVYLPADHLDAWGVTRSDLVAAAAERRSTPNIKCLIAAEIDRAAVHYQAADAGIELLGSTSQRCIRTACRLYRGILDEIVRADFEIFGDRVRVPPRRRATLAAQSLLPKVFGRATSAEWV
jgi:15-cis-phytoene synthase